MSITKEGLIQAIADLTQISATRKLDKSEEQKLHGVINLLRDLAVLEVIKESLDPKNENHETVIAIS